MQRAKSGKKDDEKYFSLSVTSSKFTRNTCRRWRRSRCFVARIIANCSRTGEFYNFHNNKSNVAYPHDANLISTDERWRRRHTYTKCSTISMMKNQHKCTTFRMLGVWECVCVHDMILIFVFLCRSVTCHRFVYIIVFAMTQDKIVLRIYCFFPLFSFLSHVLCIYVCVFFAFRGLCIDIGTHKLYSKMSA